MPKSVDKRVYNAADDLCRLFAMDEELTDLEAAGSVQELAEVIQEWLEDWTERMTKEHGHAPTP
jgi:hypothetical protein